MTERLLPEIDPIEAPDQGQEEEALQAALARFVRGALVDYLCIEIGRPMTRAEAREASLRARALLTEIERRGWEGIDPDDLD